MKLENKNSAFPAKSGSMKNKKEGKTHANSESGKDKW